MGNQAGKPEAAKADVKSAPKSSRDVYFVNPVVDIMIAGGGLSIIFFVFVVLLGYGPWGQKGGERPDTGAWIAYYLAFVVNYPHFAATSFRLYQSYDRMMQFPKTSFLSPVVVVAGLCWAMVDPQFAQWYAKLFITWSSYHFCAQTKGIALLYSRRLGVEVDKLTRWLIVISAHTPFLYGTIGSETFESKFYSVPLIPWTTLLGFKLSPEAAVNVSHLATGLFWIGCAAFALLVIRILILQNKVPIAALVPIVAQTLWFGPQGSHSAAFNEFVPFFHSFQYMLIAWIFQLKEESSGGNFLPAIQTVFWETAKWFILIIAGGVLLFEIWPRGLSWRGYNLQHSLACVNAAIQIHHFFVDGVIWKIRDPRTRSNLAGNIFDLAGSPREALGALA